MAAPAPWSNKELNALQDGWAAGMSMFEIGAWCGRSRAAVAGKIKRLGLTLHPQERRRRRQAAGRIRNARRKRSRLLTR